jgi:ABC-type Zn uptake system ZnuABC Zn-binding protein ZnuA
MFPERAVDPRLARALAQQAGARVGGQLYADALGPRGSRGATWPASEAANADTIVQGLTGGTRRCRIANP